jgi:hypothetical protein
MRGEPPGSMQVMGLIVGHPRVDAYIVEDMKARLRDRLASILRETHGIK